MNRPIGEEAIALCVRSNRTQGPGAPRLRLERSARVPAGTMVIALVDGEIILTHGDATVVQGAARARASTPDATRDAGASLAPAWLTLREGDLEVSVHANGAADDRDSTHVYRRPTPRPSRALLAAAAGPPGGVGSDAPTRLLSISQIVAPPPPVAVAAPPPLRRRVPASAGASSTPAGTWPRRMVLRRAALLALLVASFAFSVLARRTQTWAVARAASAFTGDRPSRASTGAAVAAGAPAPPATNESHPSSSVAGDWHVATSASLVNLPNLPSPETTGRGVNWAEPVAPARAAGAAPSSAGKTRARIAADTLATGAYAEALPMYVDLAREASDNEAYAQTAKILQLWLASRAAVKPHGGSIETPP